MRERRDLRQLDKSCQLPAAERIWREPRRTASFEVPSRGTGVSSSTGSSVLRW